MESYLPVQYVYREVAEAELQKNRLGKVFFFNAENEVDSCEGRITALKELPEKGLFLEIDNQQMIRMDRVITLFGKPGAAYDEYDAFANACLDCTGGYDL